VVGDDKIQPGFEPARLVFIVTPADSVQATSQLTDGLNCQVDVFRFQRSEETDDALVGARAFLNSLTTLVSSRYISLAGN
jgi:hypothetical protein